MFTQLHVNGNNSGMFYKVWKRSNQDIVFFRMGAKPEYLCAAVSADGLSDIVINARIQGFTSGKFACR